MNPQQITVSGGNLHQIAAQQYGDATLWNVIAQANGLADPMITSTVTLTLPPNPVGNGGLLYP